MTRTSGDERRRQLASAAVDALVAGGPSAVTTRAVAERAGVHLGTVHHVYRSKEELLAAATEKVMGSFAAALQQRVRPTLGVSQALADSLSGYWQWMRAADGLALGVLETYVAMLRSGQAVEALDAAHGVVRDLLEQAAVHDQQPPRTPIDDLARLVLIMAEGLTLVHLGTLDPRRAEDDLGRLITSLQAAV